MDTINLLSRAKSLHLVSSRLLEGLLSGNYRTVFRGPGIEFDEVREYADTDDARNIDWNVSSRMGMPFTKTYREEREVVLFLIVDVSASMMGGIGKIAKIDSANMVSALFSYAAVLNNDRVGALFFSDRVEKWVPPSKGRNHASRLVRDIVKLEPTGRGSDLGLAIKTAYETLKRRGICVILSDFRMNAGVRELTLLARKHDVIAVRIVDAGDLDFPVTGLVELRDPESGKHLLARPRSRAFRREYSEFWQMEHTSWERDLRKRGVDTLRVGTDDDPAERLIAFFSRRKEWGRRH